VNYETWNVRGTPTPNALLVVCDQCQEAHWTGEIKGQVRYCEKHHARMREGTKAEYAEARKALKKVIG